MRTLIRLGMVATCAGLAGIAACGGGGSSGTAPGDAGEQDAVSDQSVAPTDTGPFTYPDVATVVPEASVHNCILNAADGGAGDPVLLCSQETALLNLLTNAYTMGTGVAPGFSSQPPYTASTGHAWQDDLSLAASLGAFQCSALAYGDTMYLGMFDTVLADLGKLLPGEVMTAGSYDGEIYFRLRNAARGFALVGNAAVAGALDAMADAYAQAIQASFVQSVQPLPTDAGVLDAGAMTATVIGAPGAQGSVSYSPAQATMAAAALLDMAARANAAGDAGAQAAAFTASGSGALAYLWARARDPVTGLFYQALVTSSDPGHDLLAAGMYANDALLSDVQASVVLALARAQTASNALAADGGASPVPYGAQIVTLVTALTTAGLFNGQTMEGGTAPAPGAWLQGLVPSLGLTLTNQTTASSALLLGGYERTQALGVAAASQWGWEVAGLGLALDFASPSGEAGDAGLDPDAKSYSTAAVNAMVEGVTQSWYAWYAWYGQTGQPAPCAY